MVVRVFDRESLLWAPIYILPFRSECCESRLDFPIIMTSIPLFQALGPISVTMTSRRKFIFSLKSHDVDEAKGYNSSLSDSHSFIAHMNFLFKYRLPLFELTLGF